jgi:hypothetical protein
MTWAARRRFTIIAIIVGFVIVTLGAFAFFTFHQAPSCRDNRQNQQEEGIDCGGPCAYVCTASEAAPSVRFVRAVSPTPGRTDMIAYVDNPNDTVAAQGLHYNVELYSSTNTVIAKGEGTVDLPPASTVPVFVPNFYTGSQEVARAFITFDTPQHLWYRYQDTRVLPQIGDVVITTGDMPRITATAVNPSATALKGTAFIVTVFDAEGNAIAASQTVAPTIAPHGAVPLVFTWPAPLSAIASRVEVVPVVPLPTAPPSL